MAAIDGFNYVHWWCKSSHPSMNSFRFKVFNYLCTVDKKKKRKKLNTPVYFNTNYRTDMKLVPIIMVYCLLQFDALKLFLGARLRGGGNLS